MEQLNTGNEGEERSGVVGGWIGHCLKQDWWREAHCEGLAGAKLVVPGSRAFFQTDRHLALRSRTQSKPLALCFLGLVMFSTSSVAHLSLVMPAA